MCQFAKEFGISEGSAYYIHTVLVEKGFVKLRHFEKKRSRVSMAICQQLKEFE